VRFTITHRGVPVGDVELDFGGDELTVGLVRPLAGYAAVRPIVRAATDALRNDGFPGLAADPVSPSVGEGALGRNAALGRALELRDERGALVPTDFIDLAEWPGEATEITTWVRVRHAAAAVPAAGRPPRGAAPEGARPDA
jgi:hypothetical protein